VRLYKEIVVLPRSGRAFEVRTGQTLRIRLPEGPQVVDFDAFNLDNLAEAFSSSVTRQFQSVHPTTGHRLLSVPPWENVMFVTTQDTVRHEPNERGTVSHDLLFGRCTRQYRIRRYGSDSRGCEEQIAGAIAEFGLGEATVHDPFNIFMKTGLDAEGSLIFEVPDAVAGDCVDLRAEMNCLVAISTCPGISSGSVHHPVSFEIYEEESPRSDATRRRP
jgi:uncharacterized protein YcgI (DUF1989 family)